MKSKYVENKTNNIMKRFNISKINWNISSQSRNILRKGRNFKNKYPIDNTFWNDIVSQNCEINIL